MEEEKRELIEAINEIRKELGLQPYPLGHLEVKSIEELRKFYSTYFQMREEYRKKLKEEKPRFGPSFKIGLLISIPVICIVVILFLPKVKQLVRETEVSPVYEVNVTQYNRTLLPLKFSVSFAYVYNNSATFSLTNEGISNITDFMVKVDDKQIDYTIIQGEFPLETFEMLYFNIEGLCDGQTHTIEVIHSNYSSILKFVPENCLVTH
jgi:hypothetical protein